MLHIGLFFKIIPEITDLYIKILAFVKIKFELNLNISQIRIRII